MSWRSWTVVLALAATTACAGGSEDAGDGAAVDDTPTASVVSAPAAASPSTVVSPRADDAATATSDAPTRDAGATTAPAVPASDAAADGVAPTGFATVPGRVTATDGSTCDVCLWLADTPAARARGLMGVTDLSARDGMVFRWDEPTSGAFWMRDTPSPLSIAFYAADGTFVSAADMTPCLQPTPDAECARYAAAGPYQYAVEVAAGGLAPLLMGPGSRLELLAGECPRSP
jgi:uncharacterized membrane protein (UPF0127 family)